MLVACKRTINNLEEQIAQLTLKIEEQSKQIALKDELIAALLKKIYGSRSEQLNPEQLLLSLLGEETKKPEASGAEDPAPEAKNPKRNKAQRRISRLKNSLKDLLGTERTIIPAEVLADPSSYRRIGEEVNEKLHISPAAFTVERIIRPTYEPLRNPDASLITAPLEPSLLPKSHLTPSLAAHLLSEKFCYHQPYYRQQWKLKATHGIDLDRGLICKWQKHLAALCLPLWQLIATQIRQSSYLRIDETPIRYLQPGSGKAQLGYLWTYHSIDHGVLYDWHPSRASTCLDHILIDPEGLTSFQGFLQSDGYKAYLTFHKRAEEQELKITLISCLTHIRRKFVEALGDHPKLAAWILYQISKINHLESRLAQRRSGPALRKRARKLLLTRTYLHLQKLFIHLQHRETILPKSSLGKGFTTPATNGPNSTAVSKKNSSRGTTTGSKTTSDRRNWA